MVAPISANEWRRRLALYRELAVSLGDQLTCVAPDAVGDQDETLARLLEHRDAVRELVTLGARVIVPVQKGAMSQVAFWAACCELLNCAVTPALPMKKAATTPAEALAFLRDVQPADVHLLGFGLKNRAARPFFTMAAQLAPATTFTLDANLITASVGRDDAGDATRALTAAQDAIHARGFDAPDTLEAARWGLWFDWTDLASDPIAWTSRAERLTIAKDARLSDRDARSFAQDPATFLQTPFRLTSDGARSCPSDDGTPHLFDEDDADDAEDAMRWWEEPQLAWTLEQAYRRFLREAVVQPRKALAITKAFAHHPAARQFDAPPEITAILATAERLFGEEYAGDRDQAAHAWSAPTVRHDERLATMASPPWRRHHAADTRCWIRCAARADRITRSSRSPSSRWSNPPRPPTRPWPRIAA